MKQNSKNLSAEDMIAFIFHELNQEANAAKLDYDILTRMTEKKLDDSEKQILLSLGNKLNKIHLLSEEVAEWMFSK